MCLFSYSKLRKASDKDDVSLVSSMGSLSLQSIREEKERLRSVKKHFLPSEGEDTIIKDVENALPAGEFLFHNHTIHLIPYSITLYLNVCIYPQQNTELISLYG